MNDIQTQPASVKPLEEVTISLAEFWHHSILATVRRGGAAIANLPHLFSSAFKASVKPLAAIVITLSVFWHLSFLVVLRGGAAVIANLPYLFSSAIVWFPLVCLMLMLVLACAYFRQGHKNPVVFWTALGLGLSTWGTWWSWHGV